MKNIPFFVLIIIKLMACDIVNDDSSSSDSDKEDTKAKIGIGEAVNNTDLTWTTDSKQLDSDFEKARWFGMDGDSIPDGDGQAAKSGQIKVGESTWIKTSITGPAKLDFWWLNDFGLTTYDSIEFEVNGKIVYKRGRFSDRRTPNVKEWAKISYQLDVGTHKLRWLHSIKETSDNAINKNWGCRLVGSNFCYASKDSC